MSRSSKWFPSSHFSGEKNCMQYFSMCVKCPVHLIIFERPNILLSFLFSTPPKACSSLTVRDQVSTKPNLQERMGQECCIYFNLYGFRQQREQKNCQFQGYKSLKIKQMRFFARSWWGYVVQWLTIHNWMSIIRRPLQVTKGHLMWMLSVPANGDTRLSRFLFFYKEDFHWKLKG